MLVPSGKRRLMVAQTMPSPTSEMAGELDTTGIDPEQVPSAEDPGNEQPNIDQLENQVDQLEEQQNNEEQPPVQQNTNEGDIRHTVFEFLVGLGYPPRRLQEFRSKFVSETGSANSGTQVTLVLPDEVYGKNTQIPREKLKELVQIVEQKHALSFQDYKRANEQLTLNFISSDAAAQQSMEDAGPGDILDKVYGKPAGGGKGKPNMKNAKTITELIKESQEKQYNLMQLVFGSKNGTKNS